MKSLLLKCVSAAVLLVVTGYGCAAGEEMHSNSAGNPGRPEVSQQSSVIRWPFEVFRRYVSPVDGDRCPMHPSCSAYSEEAFDRHGVLMGWIMTCDRLMRCGRDEVRLAPSVSTAEGPQIRDTLTDNDFWLK